MAILSTVSEIIIGSQTEIAIFIIAICAHAVLFGSYRFKPSSPKLRKKQPPIPSKGQDAKPARPTRLARSNKELVSQGNNQESISREEPKKTSKQEETSKQIALLKSFATAGRLQEAIKVFEACPEKNAFIYNALLDACIDCQDMTTAEHIMSKATAAGVADVVTYNTIIKAHLQAGGLPRARAAMESMRKVGIMPNCVTFNELINATSKTSTKDAWNLIDEMQSCGLKPNQVTCSILLRSIQHKSRVSEIERTMALLDSLEDEMDEVLLSSACEACIRVERADLLVQRLKRQRSSKVIHIKGAHSFGSLIRAHGFLKDLAGVWAMWHEMRKQHIVPTSITIGCMVEALVLNGKTEDGYELIRELLSDEQTRPLVNAVIYCSVLKGFSRQKSFDRVWALYQEMIAEKMRFSVTTYNALIDACVRSSEMSRIQALMEDMAGRNIEPNTITYSTILKGYCNEGRISNALELLKHMRNTMQFRPDEITYNTLLDGCARLRMYDQGIALLSEMQEEGVRPSNFTLSVLAKLAVRSNRTDMAFDLCKEIAEKYHIRFNVHVFNNLVQACTVSGDLERALVVFEQMLREKVSPDTRTYTLLLRSFIMAKDAQGAAGLLRAAMGMREGVHLRIVHFRNAALPTGKGSMDPEFLSEVLEGIAGHCGNETLALQLFKELRTMTNIRLDPRLSMRLTSTAIHMTATVKGRP